MKNKYTREGFFLEFGKMNCPESIEVSKDIDLHDIWKWIEAYRDKEIEHERHRIIRVIVRVVDKIEAEGQGNTTLFQRIRNSIIDTFDNSEIVERVLDVKEGEK